jgi:hypothetical protein
MGKHSIDMQGIIPCRMTFGRLYFWEEVEVNQYIQTFVQLGKMFKNMFEHARKVTLLVKKDRTSLICRELFPVG